jgi:hypothetical protein
MMAITITIGMTIINRARRDIIADAERRPPGSLLAVASVINACSGIGDQLRMASRDIAMEKRRRLLGAVTALACGLATSASAEVHVEGDLSALRMTISGDALSDVLSALGASFPVKYRTTVPLDAEISGAYSGSLSRVVARLLDGYSYVIKRDREQTEIIVFGRKDEIAVPPMSPAAKGALSRWR